MACNVIFASHSLIFTPGSCCFPNAQSRTKSNIMNNNRTVVILATLLLLSLIGLGWFWMKSSRLQGENTGFETQVDSLSTLK